MKRTNPARDRIMGGYNFKIMVRKGYSEEIKFLAV